MSSKVEHGIDLSIFFDPYQIALEERQSGSNARDFLKAVIRHARTASQDYEYEIQEEDVQKLVAQLIKKGYLDPSLNWQDLAVILFRQYKYHKDSEIGLENELLSIVIDGVAHDVPEDEFVGRMRKAAGQFIEGAVSKVAHPSSQFEAMLSSTASSTFEYVLEMRAYLEQREKFLDFLFLNFDAAFTTQPRDLEKWKKRFGKTYGPILRRHYAFLAHELGVPQDVAANEAFSEETLLDAMIDLHTARARTPEALARETNAFAILVGLDLEDIVRDVKVREDSGPDVDQLIIRKSIEAGYLALRERGISMEVPHAQRIVTRLRSQHLITAPLDDAFFSEFDLWRTRLCEEPGISFEIYLQNMVVQSIGANTPPHRIERDIDTAVQACQKRLSGRSKQIPPEVKTALKTWLDTCRVYAKERASLFGSPERMVQAILGNIHLTVRMGGDLPRLQRQIVEQFAPLIIKYRSFIKERYFQGKPPESIDFSTVEGVVESLVHVSQLVSGEIM